MAKKNSYLGVDLGGRSLKVVELASVNNRPQLVNYGFIENTPDIISDSGQQSAVKEMTDHLKGLLKESRISSLKAVSSLPNFSVFSSIINLPPMDKKDLISAVRWEAKKFVPIPLEETILDWEVLQLGEVKEAKGERSGLKQGVKGDNNAKGVKPEEKKQSNSKKGVQVLLTAAPKKLVNKYVELFKGAGLQLVGLETESFALERALIGNDKNSIMVIDIGSKASNVAIFTEGIPIMNRSIDVGGKTVTKAFAEVMGLNEEQAEQFKKDMNVALTEEFLNQLPQPASYMVNSILNEIRYILNIYRNQGKPPIAKIILTGGSSYLMNISDYIGNIFNIKSFVGDPWARVVHPVELDSLLKYLGPRLSVSVGLAMREII